MLRPGYGFQPKKYLSSLRVSLAGGGSHALPSRPANAANAAAVRESGADTLSRTANAAKAEAQRQPRAETLP